MKEIKPILDPVPGVVQLLETMLEEAKSGRLRSVAVAGVMSSSEVCNGWAGSYYPVALVGELAVVQREVMDANIDMRSKPAGEGYIE